MARATDERERLLLEWKPLLMSVTRSVCRHRQDVDDAYIEAQLAFLEAYPRFPGGNLHGWIARVVRGELYTWFAKQSRRRCREILIEDLSRLGGEQSDIADETIERIEQEGWLANLSEPHQQAITLCIHEGLQQTRAAAIAEVPVNTMKSRLNRAQKRLRVIAKTGDPD